MSHVVLKVLNGVSIGQRLQLRPGQVARVGSTEWADFCVRGDTRLAEIHFSLAVEAQGCVLRDLSGRGVLVNQRPTTEALVRSGDRLIAGETQFSVSFSGVEATATVASQPDHRANAGPSAGLEDNSSEITAAQIAERCDLEPAARALLAPELSADDYLAQLISAERWLDAVKFLAQSLPKRDAIRWGVEMLRLTAPPAASDVQIFDHLEQWCDEPNDARRRAIMTLAERNQFQSPAAWLAAAAFWSEGSMLAPDLPEVPADAGLTGRTIGTALTAAAWIAAPRQPETVWRTYLQHGNNVRRAAFVTG